MKTLFLTLVVSLAFSLNLLAQEKSGKEVKAEKYSFNYSYDRAIKAYSQTKNLSVAGQRALADSYQKTGLYKLSEESYAKLINNGLELIPEDYYNSAMVLKINGKYIESNRMMDKFAALRPNDLRVIDYLANKDKLAELQSISNELYVENQTINTDASDFGTAYFNNKVVFASTKTNRKIFVSKYNWTNKPFWSMYVSEVKEGQMQTPERFAKGLNGNLHDGPVSFSNNGTQMAFTRNHYRDRSMDKVVELQIWFSELIDEKWSKPEPFAYNNAAYSVGQPCLSADGKTMYFTSDMPGGFGGSDIYKSVKNTSGYWSTPVNQGDRINTEGDEMFPFLEENSGTFLFSSNGRFGLGGLDVFISHFSADGFSKSYNPGAPLNTQFDDFAAIMDGKMNQGYFSTNRSGGSGGDDIYAVLLKDPDVTFTVSLPGDNIVVKKIRETFPIRNYIFFTSGSTEIPDRYVLLSKAQVKDFKEDRLEEFTSKNPAGRSARQMNVYYNVINILGNRMYKFPEAKITLIGASENGINDAEAMASSVKNYLVNIFGIAGSRIKIEGREKPKLPSEQVGGVSELTLLREGDQRVSIESSTPAILMEFKSGPDAPLKPVEIVTVDEPKQEQLVAFKVAGAKAAFTSWSLEIRNEKNDMKYFGPYTQEQVDISRALLLNKQSKGNYLATMTGKTRMGRTIVKEALLDMTLVKPPKVEEVMRFSIIYEFDDAVSILIYEKYLTQIVTPKIPANGKVIIRGYTDIIGDADYNQRLSLLRANDVRKIMEDGLKKSNRSDVTFDVRGYGEDEKTSPFENNYPEERFYNRTVIIDIMR